VETLVLAAGGGGDALGALMVTSHVGCRGTPLIATYAWERLRIDPSPGPRGRDGFSGLGLVGGVPAEILMGSDTVPPGSSTLPRLVQSSDLRLFLLDPLKGALGLHEQIVMLAESLSVRRVVVLDVGGDILGRGDEPNLLSPLADGLVLSSTFDLNIPVEAWVLGPSVDGELDDLTVHRLLESLGAERIGNVNTEDATPVLKLLEWHPSEATALVSAAALGIRGSVEMRRRDNIVILRDGSATLWRVPVEAMRENSLFLEDLSRTSTLDEADDVIRPMAGSELDYERDKAKDFVPSLGSLPDDKELRHRVTEYAKDALSRGVEFITVRRLAEAIKAPSATFPDVSRVMLSGRDYRRGPLMDVQALASAT
jgi:hypothetical protein